ncbi:hypothetical protein BC829DRAFT_28190 [Chytridium lagenaria]|nr:hypothetical protein BC829DRAFT_28190 [Chytridium lagenaria]
MSGPEYLTSNDPSPYETNLRENDIIEVLEYIGISKKLTGTGIIDDIIGFLGVKNGNSDGFLNNPVGVRTIIVRILSVITKALGFKVVFMIDNCQWADMRSLTAIKNMFYANLNMMFLLLCRPLVEVNEPAILADLKAIVRMPSVLKVMLDTMDVAGTEAMILKYLGFRPHPSLTQEVFRNSGGIPMVIEILASGLKAHGQTRMMDDGFCKAS